MQDGLVNNVGTNVRKPIGEATPAEYDTMMSTNVSSCYFLCKDLRPFLSRSKFASSASAATCAGVSQSAVTTFRSAPSSLNNRNRRVSR